jgi:uncharacterized protein (TIGR02996 family)
MDATLAGLIHGCAAALEDNAPWLILADWLEDHGQAERAELVRVQCRLADWVPDWQERQALIARQDELIAAHRDVWLGPLAGLCHRVEFVRGLCRVWVVGKLFATPRFDKAFAAAPGALVEQVRLIRCKSLARILGRSALARIPALSLAGLGLDDAALEPLFDSPRAANLVDLDLSNNALTPSTVLRLGDAPLGRGLVRLALRNHFLMPATLGALLGGVFPVLRELDVAGNFLSQPVVEQLAGRLVPGRIMNSVGMEFVRIPAGSFLMGATPGERDALDDESPQHPVTLTRPFWLGRFAVTEAQYWRGTGAPISPSHELYRPAQNVSGVEAEELCRLLGDLPEEKATGRSYRLPTEAEWEHACRAGTFTMFHTGDELSLDDVNYHGRWDYQDHATRRGPGRTQPVGTYPPNAFGLYEMHGNIWEWCADRYSARWYDQGESVDPVGPANGRLCITRGGCWAADGSACRSARRGTVPPDEFRQVNGFRVVLVTAE